MYVGKLLEPYLEEWESMIKTVLVDNLSKEEALIYEDNIIRALKINDLCINTNRSGLFRTNDANAYNRELKKQRYQTDIEYREKTKQYQKQWRLDNPEYDKQYYERNKEKRREYDKQRYEHKKLEKQQTSVH